MASYNKIILKNNLTMYNDIHFTNSLLTNNWCSHNNAHPVYEHVLLIVIIITVPESMCRMLSRIEVLSPTHTRTHTHMYARMHALTHTHTHMYACTHPYTYTHVRKHAPTCTHAHTYTHTHWAGRHRQTHKVHTCCYNTSYICII